MTCSTLAQLSDENLHIELKRLVGRTNTLTAELLAHLAEVETRGIHRERACSSLYTYCVYELCMSEDEAQRRCRAARLARQSPVLLEMLAEASLHLTGLLLIGPYLTSENQSELLARVRYRTKREIERLVGELAPAPEVPARIEPLHGEQAACVEELNAAPARQRNTWAAYVRALAGPIRTRAAGVAFGQAPPSAAPESCVDLTKPTWATAERPAPQPRPAARPENGPQASGGARYRIQFTADQAYLDLLEEARQLLQHVVPDRDLVEVQRRALQALVKGLRARKLGATERPRSARQASPEHHGESARQAKFAHRSALDRHATPEDAAIQCRAAPERPSAAPERRTAPERGSSAAPERRTAMGDAAPERGSSAAPERRTAPERPAAMGGALPERRTAMGGAAPEPAAGDGGAAPEFRAVPARRSAPARRAVPAGVRRTVWQRDEGRCVYADSRGQRCRERSGLELHHREPHAHGGTASVDNLELRCRAHNALAAEYDFGRERIREMRQRGAGARPAL